MTILEHPEWPLLRRYLYIRRGRNGVNGARHRLEVHQDAPASVFAIRTACAYCGREIQNVRRDARGAWTFNASCPLAVNPKCARMPPTTALCESIRRALGEGPSTLPLFEGQP